MFRLLKQWLRGIPSIQLMRIPKVTPQHSVLAMAIHTGSTGKESENFKPSGYVNGRGESVCNLVIPFPPYNHRQSQPLTRPRINTDHIQ